MDDKNKLLHIPTQPLYTKNKYMEMVNYHFLGGNGSQAC
jgi:hypothetical protein